MRAVCSGKLGGTDALLMDGLFKKLLDPKEFRRVVYPGISLPKDSKVPRSLKEMLDDEKYAAAFETLAPRVKSKAHTVLENVKRRGAREGDIMDARTEEQLRPQVYREAF